ncbi:MAG: TolC family protein [Myxococcales bacterium]|nr:TolC family protein [Myxococcales bacterium]
MTKVPRALCLAAVTFATGAALLVAAPVSAQPAPAPAPKPDEEKLGPGEDAVKDKEDPLLRALAPQPGGLTLAQVAREAVATSTAVRVRQADIEDAAGQTDQTLVQFFPRLTLGASYTRLSDIDQPSLGGGGAVVGTANEGPVTVGPCPDNPAVQCVLDSGGLPAQAASFGFEFPVILNQYAFTGSINVPISDYFLRSVQAYNAAQHNEKSLELALAAERLNVAAQAKLALLNWVLARGATVVQNEALEAVKAQLADAKATFEVGNASQADVLRIEAQLAQAEYSLSQAQAAERVALSRLRTTIHAPSKRQLTIGVDVINVPKIPAFGSEDELVQEAVQARLELESTAEARKALEEADSATAAGYWPRLDAFADGNLANPNPRIVPSREQFDFTWAVGARLTWSVNDTFATLGASRQARSRVARVDAQRDQLIDAIRVEVSEAHADISKAVPNIEAAARGVKAAEESLRVTKKLFAFGKATGTSLVDAQNAVTVARLQRLIAQVNLLGAIIRLEHATGRDRAIPAVGPTR